MAEVKPVRARLGPHSTKMRVPSAYMRSIWLTHSTGLATWRARSWTIFSGSSGYQRESTLVVIGRWGARMSSFASTSPRGSDAGATIALWKAWLTGSGKTVIPRLRKDSQAASTASVAPAMTVCLGLFLLAATT